jgi:DNA invertase Pin-like site-specific DNA recombinase
MRIGYARVSTSEQNLDPQRDALKRAGCETIIEAVASGKTESRSGLDRAPGAVAGRRHAGCLAA